MKELISLAAQSHAQKELVLFLREYFSKQPDELYKWTKNQANTNINITTVYNDTQRMQIPSVIVEDVTGNIYNRVLGQEMITEIKEDKEINGKIRPCVTGYNLHGVYSLTCNISIIDYNVSSRRMVTDLVGSAFRHIGVQALKQHNIEISNVQVLAPRYKKIGNQMLQTGQIKLDFVTNWNMKVTDFDKIEQILIKEIKIDGIVETDPTTGKNRTVTIPPPERRNN